MRQHRNNNVCDRNLSTVGRSISECGFTHYSSLNLTLDNKQNYRKPLYLCHLKLQIVRRLDKSNQEEDGLSKKAGSNKVFNFP